MNILHLELVEISDIQLGTPLCPDPSWLSEELGIGIFHRMQDGVAHSQACTIVDTTSRVAS